MGILKGGFACLLALAVAASLPLNAAAQASAPSPYGIWRNPKGSVHLRIHPCGTSVCGNIIWANPTAQADARKGGTDNLIGLQIFRDFAQDPGGGMRGKVFVPDLNMTLSGSATLIDPNSLRAKGCLIGRVLCKSQVWTRLADVAGGT
jgi:uncharacterized protein (DUF2147 family)